MSDEVVVNERDLTILFLAVGVLIISVVLNVATLVYLAKQAQTAGETHRAACTFRANLVQQVQDSEKYLEQHPNGAPSLGISAAQLRQSIGRQRAAANSLSDLHCP